MRRSFLSILLSTILLAWIGPGLLGSKAEAAPPPPRGDISGLVLADGVPAAGAIVQLYGGVGFIDYVAETVSDSSGHFRFRRIAAGSYSVVAYRLSPSQACTGNAPVTVVAGQTVNVTVSMSCQSIP